MPITSHAAKLQIAAVSASSFNDTNGPNVPENTVDGLPATVWSARGQDPWIQYYLDANEVTVSQVKVAWLRGHERKYTFKIELSSDAKTWSPVSQGQSHGTTEALETYDFNPAPARYVRITCGGNTQSGDWSVIREAEIHGTGVQDSGIKFPYLGQIQPRSATQIKESNWSIGGETMDRDFTLYEHWKAYLGPLGAKRVRIQSGWARTEKQRGVYDWAWLDRIVRDIANQGVKPWLNVSYGNLLYPGGGGANLGDGLPTSDEALAAWDQWAEALARRYGDVVNEWEIWNEPNLQAKNTPEIYARFLMRTAAVVRKVQPTARIIAIGLAGAGSDYVDSVLKIVKAQGKLALVNEISYHPYNPNPDSSYAAVRKLRALVTGYSPDITLRQGENGAPSNPRTRFALSGHAWTELSQAKWNLRRLLGDLGHDIPSNLFTMTDMLYTHPVPYWNTKGLLLANGDKTIARPKASYAAMQHLTAIFDDRLARIPGFKWASPPPTKSLAVYTYNSKATNRQAITIWMNGAVPSDANDKTAVDFTFASGDFEVPVYVDLRTGRIYQIPLGNWSKAGPQYTFRAIPCYDSPILIADRSLVIP